MAVKDDFLNAGLNARSFKPAEKIQKKTRALESVQDFEHLHKCTLLKLFQKEHPVWVECSTAAKLHLGWHLKLQIHFRECFLDW